MLESIKLKTAITKVMVHNSPNTSSPNTLSPSGKLSTSVWNPNTWELPITLSPNTNPHYQGIEGKGWFIGAMLTILTTHPTNIEQLSFALKIDDNLVFYGTMAMYPDSMGIFNPIGVEVAVIDHMEPGPGKSLISISMRLPNPVQFSQTIKVAVTIENSIESTCLYMTAAQEEKKAESKQMRVAS